MFFLNFVFNFILFYLFFYFMKRPVFIFPLVLALIVSILDQFRLMIINKILLVIIAIAILSYLFRKKK